jgi:hypothetical protein
MPRPTRVCAEPHCHNLHTNPQPQCDEHLRHVRRDSRARNPEGRRSFATPEERAARRRELDAAGWRCRDCGEPTRQVDHVDGDRDNIAPGNLRARCQRCHSSKTATQDQHRDADGRFTGKGASGAGHRQQRPRRAGTSRT